MKHQVATKWHKLPDEGMTIGYWQAECECGWLGHRELNLADAGQDGARHSLRHFYELGERAHTEDRPPAPILNKEIVEVMSNRAVGDSYTTDVMQSYLDGWYAANNAYVAGLGLD